MLLFSLSSFFHREHQCKKGKMKTFRCQPSIIIEFFHKTVKDDHKFNKGYRLLKEMNYTNDALLLAPIRFTIDLIDKPPPYKIFHERLLQDTSGKQIFHRRRNS